MLKYFILFIVPSIVFLPALTKEDKNTNKFTTNDDIRPNLQTRSSTKTPYVYVANKNITLNIPIGDSCRPVQIWLVVRHGTRYPKKSQVRSLKYEIPVLAEKLSKNRHKVSKDVQILIDRILLWKPNTMQDFTEEHEKYLHAEGEKEMVLMAERYADRFPSLLKGHYHPELFKFRSTYTQRANQSQLYFATGLFDRRTAISDVNYEPAIDPDDPIIRFYKVCKKWNKEVKENPASKEQQRLFEQSQNFNVTVFQNLSKRMGFNSGHLTIKDVKAMWVACTFGQAWQPNETSPWCSLFTKEMLDMLEYREDLKYYWKDGYGYKINTEQACVLVKDAMDNFRNITMGGVTGKEEQNGIFYFTHSGTILKLLSYLGLYKEETNEQTGHRLELRHDNYNKMKDSRNWRTSFIDPFASNVGLVLKKCYENEYKIGLLHNEVFVDIPGCITEDKWCDHDKFLSLFNPNVTSCDFSKICETDDFNAVQTTISDNMEVEYPLPPDDRY